MTSIENLTRKNIVDRAYDCDDRLDELVAEYAQLAYLQACIDKKDPVAFLKEAETALIEDIQDTFKIYLHEE